MTLAVVTMLQKSKLRKKVAIMKMKSKETRLIANTLDVIVDIILL